MIVPMYKYSFLVYHEEYKKFLEDIQEFGIADISYDTPPPSFSAIDDDHVNKAKDAILYLQRYGEKKGVKNQAIHSAEDFLIEFTKTRENYERLVAEESNLEKEINVLKHWGNFDITKLQNLKSFGFNVIFANCPTKIFEDFEKSEYITELISHHQGLTYFLLFLENKGIKPELEYEEMHLPKTPLFKLSVQLKEIKQTIHHTENIFREWHHTYNEILKDYLESKEADYNFTIAYKNANHSVDSTVRMLTAWIPSDEEKTIMKYLESNNILFLKRKARPEDKNIPIKLTNSRFAKLFEPIGNLFSMPDYKELDMTPFFSPFFMMFFGFCLGDAGYGIVYLLVASLLKLKFKQENKRRLLSLVQFLAIATIFFGILTGTFFGISLLKVTSLGHFRDIMLDSGTVFNLALIIGLVQIYFGIAIRAANQIRQFGFAYGLSAIGWLFLIPFGLDAIKTHYTGKIGIVLFFVGLFLILFFSDPKAGIFGRIGKGIWDLYNITGIFGDVLSYIRLFALGVSSSILGFVVNDIGLQIKDAIPILGPIIFVIFITVGHLGNMMLSSLGSFVHPMRLTFVEFYKNSGFTGGGKKYNPFIKK
ncbi:MAG: V-type ATP synthase subunit I [Bacteroidales bacterium]